MANNPAVAVHPLSTPHTAAHKREIARVLEDCPGAKTKGFAAAHRALWLEIGGHPNDLPRTAFVPDAFHIDREARQLVLFEVEVSHGITDEKYRRLGEFWCDWDDEAGNDWLPVLVIVDRFGNRDPRDLGRFYHALCFDAIAA